MSDDGGGGDDGVAFEGGGVVLGGDNGDEYVERTEYEEEGYCERLGNSLGCVIVGIILFIGMFPLLYWNEGQAVQIYNTLKEGEAITISIDDPSATIDPLNNNKLIHVSDMLSSASASSSSGSELIDPIFGVSSNTIMMGGATTTISNDNTTSSSSTTTAGSGSVVSDVADILKLRRNVMMYQWKEVKRTTSRKTGAGTTVKETTYSYTKEWEDSIIDSNRFEKQSSQHQNPNTFGSYQPLILSQDPIYLGNYIVPNDFVTNQINWYTPVRNDNNNDNNAAVSTSNILDTSIKNSNSVTQFDNNDIGDGSSRGSGFYISSSGSTATNPPTLRPQIGDVIVTFQYVPATEATIVAQQKEVNNDNNNNKAGGADLVPYESKYGSEVYVFRQGYYTVAEIYEQERDANAFRTWILRFVGYVGMGLGIYLCCSPLEVLTDIIPIVGELVSCGIMLVACPIATFFAGLTISIAWLIHHPIIGIVVLVVICAVSGGLLYVINMNKTPKRGGDSGNNKQASNEDDDIANAEAAAAQAYG